MPDLEQRPLEGFDSDTSERKTAVEVGCTALHTLRRLEAGNIAGMGQLGQPGHPDPGFKIIVSY